MKWEDLQDSQCAMARALSVVGDRWTLLVVREAFIGTSRFDEFCQNIGAARHIISDRLAALVDAGVLQRLPLAPEGRRQGYQLTDKGRDLLPVVISLLQWGEKWAGPQTAGPLRFLHDDGGTVTPQLICDSCGSPTHPAELHPAFVSPSSAP